MNSGSHDFTEVHLVRPKCVDTRKVRSRDSYSKGYRDSWDFMGVKSIDPILGDFCYHPLILVVS